MPTLHLKISPYVIVRELPATDWGYSGQTQAMRASLREATFRYKNSSKLFNIDWDLRSVLSSILQD